MKKIFFAVALAIVACVSSASAGTVQFSLLYNSADLTYNLYAKETTGTGGGIASYGVVLKNVSTVDHKSPRIGFGQGPTGTGAAGFTSLRSADGLLTLLASQDTITPTPNLIYGFGQTGSSFTEKGISDFTGGSQLEQPTWTPSLLLASGTYAAGALPTIDSASVDTFSNVFVGASGVATEAATMAAAEIRDINIPEPATFAMAGLGLIGVMSAARRRNA